jgi:hypothetical protein
MSRQAVVNSVGLILAVGTPPGTRERALRCTTPDA